MFRFYGLIFLFALLVVCIAVFIGSFFSHEKHRRRIQSAFEAEYDGDEVPRKPEIDTMVSLYLTMAAKHGPDSEEAKAFRFGTGSQLMQRLHGDDLSMKAFTKQADIIDDVCRRMRKKKKPRT